MGITSRPTLQSRGYIVVIQKTPKNSTHNV